MRYICQFCTNTAVAKQNDLWLCYDHTAVEAKHNAHVFAYIVHLHREEYDHGKGAVYGR